MPLSVGTDWRPEYVEIKNANGEALGTFRGLNYTDLMVLVRDNLTVIRVAIRAMSPNGEIDRILHGQSYVDLAAAAFSANPYLGCRLMAMCSDEEDLDRAASIIGRFPFPVQMQILAEIFRMTLEDAGGPLGLLALLGRAVGMVSPETASLVRSWSGKISTVINEKLLAGNAMLEEMANPLSASTETSGTA